jgi:8-oxo-dGTP pyrophosphatase MutT (NUDIX family)
MQRKLFLDIVGQYRTAAPLDEYAVIDELIQYVTYREDCFERKHEEGAKHIATSVLLVTPDFQKALFLWHAKIKCWTQPGGHSDGDSDIHAVALKELEEETGVTGAKFASLIPLDIYRFDYAPEVFGYRKSIYNLFFVVILPTGQEPKIMEPDKCESMRWATPDEALEMIKGVPHEGTERLIRKWQAFAENGEMIGK